MIHYKLEKQFDPNAQTFDIILAIENLSVDEAIHGLDVMWSYGIENDESDSKNFFHLGRFKQQKITEFEQAGDGDLSPGERREFFFPREYMKELLSEIDSLCSDSYAINIRGNDDLLGKISGREFGGWVCRNFSD